VKIMFVGHASILIEAAGITVLSDPWWVGPCFGAQWWNYPAAYLPGLANRRIDYVYLSHGHHDHFHPGTLRTISRDAKVITSSKTDLAPFVRDLGFEVIELDEELYPLGSQGATCRIMPTHGDDTLMALSDGREVCLNLNDALHSAPDTTQAEFVERLRSLYPSIDYVFCGHAVASHFPNCYVIPGKDREATARQRQQYFNRRWAKLISELQPRFGFPFAADVVFFEDDLFWANEPTHNAERPTDTFRRLYPDSAVQTLDIAPGFTIEDGTVLQRELRQPFTADALRASCTAEIERANRYGNVEESGVRDVATLIDKAAKISADYLKSYHRDYRFLIRIRNSDSGIAVEKKGRSLTVQVVPTTSSHVTDYDVVYTTRLAYLKWNFTRPNGDEILFVGSGGIFEYADAAKAKQNLHLELVQLLRTREKPPAARYGGSSRLTFAAKKAIKKLMARTETDLYSLAQWTVFKNDRA